MDGLFYEHGPFHFIRNTANDLRLYENPWAWNRISNVIYLEAPAGVGFSYSDYASDYSTNDSQTAYDNLIALTKFFQKFPQFQKNDFYIAGESYAGVYVPSLAVDVVNYNRGINPNQQINLKGVLVGNGVTVWNDMYGSVMNFSYGHSLMPTSLWQQILRDCPFPIGMNPPAACANDINQAGIYFSDNNVYDIYTPCYNPPNNSIEYESFLKINGHKPTEQPWIRLWRHLGLNLLVDAYYNQRAKAGAPGLEPPCINSNALTAYLNRPDVRVALHAAPISKVGQWMICSDIVNYTTQYQTMLPFYNILFASNVRAIAYSGDVDAAVPYPGTELWTTAIGRPLKQNWTVWQIDNQVAGYYTLYDKLTYLTVKDSGHMVPQYQPERAFVFYSAYLKGQL